MVIISAKRSSMILDVPSSKALTTSPALSGWAADGPFAIYVRSEYQHSPSAPALPLAAREAISLADFSHSIVPPPFPVPPDTPTPSINRGRLLDAYVAMNLSDWQLSFGNQSLWWGPDVGGAMMLSDNADPLRMFRVNRITPFKLPSFLGFLGPMRVEFFLGQYSGYEFMFTPSGSSASSASLCIRSPSFMANASVSSPRPTSNSACHEPRTMAARIIR